MTYDELRQRLLALPGTTEQWLAHTLSRSKQGVTGYTREVAGPSGTTCREIGGALCDGPPYPVYLQTMGGPAAGFAGKDAILHLTVPK
jgi:hypothetical protein